MVTSAITRRHFVYFRVTEREREIRESDVRDRLALFVRAVLSNVQLQRAGDKERKKKAPSRDNGTGGRARKDRGTSRSRESESARDRDP